MLCIFAALDVARQVFDGLKQKALHRVFSERLWWTSEATQEIGVVVDVDLLFVELFEV